MPVSSRRKSHKKPARDYILQAGAVAILIAVITWLASNAADNLDERGITVGFDFLSRQARFSISDSVLNYSPVDTFAWAFLVGVSNTLFLSALVAVGSTVCGFFVALGRRSSHPLARLMSTAYVDLFRNIPLVVLLLFVYAIVINGLSDPAKASSWHGFFLTNRGLYGPALSWVNGLHWDLPRLGISNIDGGWILSPELVSALVGLTVYSTAFSAEIIRGGIDAIAKGQWEAGRSLGLTNKQILWEIVLPQALSVILPPMTSQYLNIVKNSTQALVVGYAEINFVTATTINQTGQALEGTAILMSVFLCISLVASLLMNRLDRRFALVGH